MNWLTKSIMGLWRSAAVAAGLSISPAMANEQSSPAEPLVNRDQTLFDLALEFEGKVDVAVRNKDQATLEALAEVLGSVVDQSFDLKDKGHLITDCDVAIQSLHFIAASSATFVKIGSEGVGLTKEVIQEALPDYVADMNACALRLGRDLGIRPTFGTKKD